MAFLFRLFPILYAPSRIYSHRHNHSSSVNSKAINFLHLLKLSSLNENLKPIYSLLIVHGLHGNELLIREFLRFCFHLGSPYLALSVFKRVQKPKLGLQNLVIRGLCKHGLYEQVLCSYLKSRLSSCPSDDFTFPSVIKACAAVGAVGIGRVVHGVVLRTGFEKNVAKSGCMRTASVVIDRIPQPDLVSWNALISGFSLNGRDMEAFEVLVSGCVQLNSIKLAHSVMAYLIRKAFDKEATICNFLIDFQARCGEISVARKLFDGLKEKNVVPWSVMINGYGLHREGNAALDLFLQMELSGIKPDATTYSTVLSACSHSGLSEEGLKAFNSMTANNITPKMEHMLAWLTFLQGQRLPCEPSTSLLEALLGACRVHGNVEIGEKMGRKLVDLDPENSRSYVMLYNIYAAAERWMDAERVRSEMEKRGLKKAPGFSLFVGEGFHDKEFG
ncbi:hypothetical protein UlMin_039251 [Ulmus minor]